MKERRTYSRMERSIVRAFCQRGIYMQGSLTEVAGQTYKKNIEIYE